ncbi:flavodoxin family protein [uncultured Cetobacterium sp.]|uniref:flavodoxin family protein n=1 Tax=uncultured Cetobacterium sp. TaxID=527638 RepID=UPI002637377D|nr:flavodoxin family protein [uncultured Cetobacterium sp.]
MKTLITYSSKTGNTKKVAEAIFNSLSNCELKDIDEVTTLDNYDFLIIGGWIDKSTFDTKTLNFIKSIKNKKIGYFFTLGAYADSDHAKDCVNNIDTLFIENENTILKNFFCQGAIDPKLIAWMSTLPEDHKMHPDADRKKRWNDAASHPDENDLSQASKAFINIDL